MGGRFVIRCQGEEHWMVVGEDGTMTAEDHNVAAEMAMLALSDWRDPPPCVLVYLAAMRVDTPWDVQIRCGVLYGDQEIGTMVDVTVRR